MLSLDMSVDAVGDDLVRATRPVLVAGPLGMDGHAQQRPVIVAQVRRDPGR
jgi:hypothetical protein